MNSKKIGEFISELRKEQGLKQQELAEKLSVTDKAISKWETGKGIPDISIIQSLSATLGVSVEELLNGERMPDTATQKDEEIIKKLKLKNYIRLAVELVITIVFVYWIYVFFSTFRGFANVIDIYLHKAEIKFTAACMAIFIICAALWLITVIISLVTKRKASVIKTIIICLSFSFVVGASLKMAEYDNAKIVAMYDEPIKTVSYVEYSPFFNDDFETQITINETNDVITENYKAYFYNNEGTRFVYTNCVTTNSTELTKKYYEEQKEIYTYNTNPIDLTADFCRNTGITEGYYVTNLYNDTDIALYFIKDKRCYSVNISNTDITDSVLIEQLKAL